MEKTDTYYTALGAQIRALRNSAGLTQKEAAAIVGKHYTHLGQIERGEIPISSKFLAELLAVYQGVAVIDGTTITVCRKLHSQPS